MRTIADFTTPILSLKPRRGSQLKDLPVNEFVKINHNTEKPKPGIEGYNMPDNYQRLTITPLHAKIFEGKNRNYIDEAISLKSHVPNKFYDVTRDMVNP